MADEGALSVEETNKLRASLGLKPLSVEPSKPAKPAKEEVPQPSAERDAEQIRQRLAERRERRRQEELAATRTLGEADEGVDDTAAWIARQRIAAAEAAHQRAAQEQQHKQQPGLDDGEGEGGGEVAELAGAKVAADVADLVEGESLVLTLADQPLLDEKGRLQEEAEDMLENVLQREQAKRSKARKAAGKAGQPLWGEDGKTRSLLDKYDEEEEEMALAFDAGGRLQAEAAHQEEVRQRLAQAAQRLDASVEGREASGAGDFYTAGEMEALQQPKKKRKKRKLRTTKVAHEEEGDGGLDLDALEAAAAAAEGESGLGSKAERSSRREQVEAAQVADRAEKAARFEAALDKANWASTFLRPEVAAAAGGGGNEDEADAELAESLARVRRLAQSKASSSKEGPGERLDASAAAAANRGAGGASSSMEALAAQLAQKRQQDEEARNGQGGASGEAGVELFTETTEFVRAVQVTGPTGTHAGGVEEDGPSTSYMDMDEVEAPPQAKPAAPQQPKRKFRKGGWVSLEEEAAAQEAEQAPAGGGSQGDGQEVERSVIAEQAVGKGLAGALALLKGQGQLKAQVNWGGRTNDKKPVALIGLEDVYTGGAQEEATAQRIETALTQRDEFGRIMTPKERFRQLCYDFHGMKPSKNKQEKRQRKYLEEVAVQRATTSTDPSADLGTLRQVQQQLGTAYIPLDGKAKGLGRGRGREEPDDLEPLPGTASIRKSGTGSVAPTPVLGGGITPLTGKRKVEMMLGIASSSSGGGGGKKGGSSGRGSMAPPPARR